MKRYLVDLAVKLFKKSPGVQRVMQSLLNLPPMHTVKTYTFGCNDVWTDCPYEVTAPTPEEAMEKGWKHSSNSDHLKSHMKFRAMMGDRGNFEHELLMLDIMRMKMRKGKYTMGKLAKKPRKI